MPGPYPGAYDGFVHPTNGVTNANEALFDPWVDALNNQQTYVGLSGDPAASSGTLSSKIAYLLAAPGGITKATTAPLSPATNDLWIDTSTTTRPLAIFYSAAWHDVGANALQLQGVTVHTAAPTDGQVLTYDLANTRWAPAAATGGLTDPETTIGDMIYRNASNVTARLPIGSAGQVLGIAAGIPAWTTLAFIADPAGAPIGAVLVKNASSVWSYVAPTTSGYVLTDNGVGAAPTFQVIPISSPGTGITTPAGVRVGDLVQYNELGAWVSIHPGTAGQVLTAHGDNNVAGSKLTWTTPGASGFTNPMTTLSDLIIGDTGGAAIRLSYGGAGASDGKFLKGVAGAPAWGNLGGGLVDTFLEVAGQGSAPATGAAHRGRFYVLNSDDHPYYKGPDGVTHDLLAAGSGYNTIQNAGTPLTARTTVNFTGAGVSAADTGGITVVTIAGGGSGGSRLSRTTAGLVLWHDYSQVPDHALTTSADALGYAVRTTYDHGTWAFRNGLLTCTGGNNPEDCSNLVVSQRYGVFQTRFYTPAVGSTQGGLEFAVQAGVDTRMLYLVRNGDATVWDRTAGSWGSSHGGTTPSGMIQGQWIAAKVRWTSTQVLSAYTNRVLLDSAFTHTGVPLAAGGIGLVAVSAANTVFKDYAIYSSTVLTVAGLSGTQAFRIMDAGGNQLAASGTQSSGTATIDLAAIADAPIVGSIEVHTSTAFSSLIAGGRYPAEGIAENLWPGDTYTYT